MSIFLFALLSISSLLSTANGDRSKKNFNSYCTGLYRAETQSVPTLPTDDDGKVRPIYGTACVEYDGALCHKSSVGPDNREIRGRSFCYTDSKGSNWGAPCVPCPGSGYGPGCDTVLKVGSRVVRNPSIQKDRNYIREEGEHYVKEKGTVVSMENVRKGLVKVRWDGWADEYPEHEETVRWGWGPVWPYGITRIAIYCDVCMDNRKDCQKMIKRAKEKRGADICSPDESPWFNKMFSWCKKSCNLC